MNKKEIKKLLATKIQLNRFMKRLQDLEISLRTYCHNSINNKKFTTKDLPFLNICPGESKFKNRLDLDTAIAWGIANKVSHVIFYLPRTNNVSLLNSRYSKKIILKEIRDAFHMMTENLNYFIEFINDISTLVEFHEEKYEDLFDLCSSAVDEFEYIYPYFSKKLETVQGILDKEYHE